MAKKPIQKDLPGSPFTEEERREIRALLPRLDAIVKSEENMTLVRSTMKLWAGYIVAFVIGAWALVDQIPKIIRRLAGIE